MKTLLISLTSILLLSGCGATNGLFNVLPEDCSITTVEADLEGTFTDTDAEGDVYVRRGNCDAEDRRDYRASLATK